MTDDVHERLLVPGAHPGYYGVSVFWHDYEVVEAWMNERIANDPHRTRLEHFAVTAGRTFERAFMLNCGNGWVERELHDAGVIRSAVGVDCDEELLAEARRLAPPGFEYHCCEVNRSTLPTGPFDLVVNNEAAHHVVYLDRVVRAMRERITPDGWLLSYDYTGPHRNQYDHDAWFTIDAVNSRLPASFRQDMFGYPHLPTMLLLDPTEAVHSELVQATLARYFVLEQEVPLGGAIAYPLLTHNRALYDAEPAARDAAVRLLLEADEEYLRAHPSSSLFTYSVGRPRELPDDEILARWTAEEEAREVAAAAADGEYYERSLLQSLYLELEDRRVATIRAHEERERVEREAAEVLAFEAARHEEALDGLRKEVAEIRASTSWRITGPVRGIGHVMRTRRPDRGR